MASLYNKSFGSTGALGYENPAFKISIIAPNDDLQQKQGVPRSNPNTDFQDNVEVGTVVTATIDKKSFVGKISRIFKNDENDTVYVEIVSNTGKKFKIDSSRIRAVDTAIDEVPDNLAQNISTNGIFQENRFMSFDNFVLETRLMPGDVGYSNNLKANKITDKLVDLLANKDNTPFIAIKKWDEYLQDEIKLEPKNAQQLSSLAFNKRGALNSNAFKQEIKKAVFDFLSSK
jgi:hypothetical protein